MPAVDRHPRALRWGVLALGLVLTALAGLHVYTAPGVYWSRTAVRLYAPDSTVNPNKLQVSSGALIETAGVVTRALDGGSEKSSLPVDPSVTIADRGIHDGWTVFQPDYGGQWAINYTIPVILVDVAAPDAETVTRRSARLVSEVEQTLAKLQRDAGVVSRNLVVARPDFSSARVQYSKGHRPLAVVVTLAIGVSLSAAAASFVAARSRRRTTSTQVPSQL